MCIVIFANFDTVCSVSIYLQEKNEECAKRSGRGIASGLSTSG